MDDTQKAKRQNILLPFESDEDSETEK